MREFEIPFTHEDGHTLSYARAAYERLKQREKVVSDLYRADRDGMIVYACKVE